MDLMNHNCYFVCSFLLLYLLYSIIIKYLLFMAANLHRREGYDGNGDDRSRDLSINCFSLFFSSLLWLVLFTIVIWLWLRSGVFARITCRSSDYYNIFLIINVCLWDWPNGSPRTAIACVRCHSISVASLSTDSTYMLCTKLNLHLNVCAFYRGTPCILHIRDVY